MFFKEVVWLKYTEDSKKSPINVKMFSMPSTYILEKHKT